ncbi:MAG: DUF2800 domain-containing protein [Dorea sp.]|nr:DUF2800 domain-containing protein [Dorea sp.]
MAEKKRAHAFLSASSAKKWLNCTPSARLEETIPDSTSKSAEEGTLAHSICELKLRKLFTEQGMTSQTYNRRMNKLKKDKLYQPEMDKHTDTYVEYIQQLAYSFPAAPSVAVEKELDYGDYAPEGFGTADCIVISGTECYVIDFKYGQGVHVYAEGNPQMSLYALGALSAYGMIYPIHEVTLVIIQPRLNNISEWKTTADYLRTWGGEIVKPKATLAFKGEGDFCQGEWCDNSFCRASAICGHRAKENMSIEQDYLDPVTGRYDLPPVIDNSMVGAILERAQNLAKWVKKLERYALEELVNGNAIPGWKIVEGRSNREFTDIDKAYEALIEAGYKKELLYDQVPVPLTKAEKQISKEDYNNVLAKFIIKPKGKPTLALESDKRPVYEKQPSAEEAFGGENSYKEEQK